MKVTGETRQPVVIDINRAEAKELIAELHTILNLSSCPRLAELLQQLAEAERHFKQQEYQGPG